MSTKYSGTAARDLPELAALLVDAVRLMRRDFYQRADGLSLTPALGRLLYYVERNPASSQVELAAQLEVTPVTLSRMVDRLVRSSFVKRVPDPADRRVYRVVLEKAGRPIVNRMRALSRKTTARALRGLSPRERKALALQLSALCRNLSSD